jgi:dienelactone hydrolase
VTVSETETLSTADEGRINFSSYTPKSMFDLARERRENWVPQKVWGDLRFPASAKTPIPVIVLMHGSGGIEASMRQWEDAFNDIGVATFVVSVFEPRGVKRTAENQNSVPAASDVTDALQALKLLATHPRIDPARIGIMGFSRGGSTSFQVALEPFRKALIKNDLKYALHIPTYAGCNQVFWSQKVTKAPILNLLGGSDDYTTPEPCERLAIRYANAGTPVKTIIYPNANHAWDAMYRVFRMEAATSAAPCGVIRWDMEPWTITSEKKDAVIAPEKFPEFFNGCVRRGGVHVGRDELAFRQSRRDAQAFVKEVFFGTR